MFRKILVGISCPVVAFLSVIAMGEDAVTADPKHYVVEFENERIRIIRVNYGPGEKSVMHTHGPNAAIFLSDINVRMHLPDGSSTDIAAGHGEAQWAENEEHMPENIGDEAFEVILVELKE